MNITVTADGARYLSASIRRVPYPFHFRWLLPRLLKRNLDAWAYVSRGSIVAIGILTAVYAGSPWMACVAFLPGFILAWKSPVLVDAPAMALSILSAILWRYNPYAAVAIVLVAGCTRETAPIWAAIYAWNPILLVGMIPVGIRALYKPGPDPIDIGDHQWIVSHPFQAGMKYHAGRWRDPKLMLLPWGGMLAALANADLQLSLAVVVGYGQMLMASDSVRLYQWAAPVVALACTGLPGWTLPLIAVGVVFNPWAGDGV